MKTILWKELRENARWVPLGLIPTLIILVLKWRSNELIFESSPYGNSIDVSMLVGLVACGVATCLGVLQSWPDQRPAARALLMHRGITANAVFGGKLLAGLLLYAAAVFVPLLGMALFIACVGIEHRAASPGALLPSALISVVAFSCWLASLLVVQRDAWFVGSRLLPGVTAAIAVFGCGVITYEIPWLAVSIVVVTLAALLAAARSVFVSSGQTASGAGRAGLALAVGVPLLTMAMCLVSMIESYRRQDFYTSEAGAGRYHVVEFGPDGQLWLTHVDYTWRTGERKFAQVAKMQPGKSVRDQLEPADESWQPLRRWAPYQHPTYDVERFLGGRFVSIGIASIGTDASVLHRAWVFDAKRDVILVYRTRLRTGNQLEATLLPPAAVGSFGQIQDLGSTDAAGNFTLVSSTGVFRVPGSGTEVETIYAIPKSASFVGSELPTRRQLTAPSATFIPQTDSIELMLRLDDRVVLLGNDEADAGPSATSVGPFKGIKKILVTEVRLPDELAKAVHFSIAVAPAEPGSYVGLARDPFLLEERVDWFRFDDQGRILEQHGYNDADVTAGVEGSKAVAAFIPPIAFAYGVVMIAIENERHNGVHAAWEYAKKHPIETGTITGFAMLQPIVGIPLALWGARRRRLGKRTTWFWVCWAFWFGPYVGLSLLAVYPRIVREPCSACQGATRVDLANCEHCACSLDETPRTHVDRGLAPHNNHAHAGRTQSHALEPAAGPDSNEDSSPPAQ